MIKKEEILIDSSAFYAILDASTDEHEIVKDFIKNYTAFFVTTNFIFAEVLSLMTKRLGKHIGIKWGSEIQNSKTVRIINVNESYQKEAWDLYKTYLDKDFDFIDAISFTLMKYRKIKKALTLDKHFSQMGFVILPK